MREFKNEEEMRNDKELQNMGDYDYKKIIIDGKKVICCPTN